MGPLAAARRALALNCRDGGLPCREGEKATLRRFIGQAVEEGETRQGAGGEQGLPVRTPAEAAGLGEIGVHNPHVDTCSLKFRLMPLYACAVLCRTGGDSPGVLYICGVPGTGKTACVMEVLGGVRQQAQQNGVQVRVGLQRGRWGLGDRLGMDV